ncbi:1-phosphofructokinase family hexose kinase [Agromyces humatus]|uniref:Hexose kinase n=1 Tax=Agromyces humatus TaxID=279573 RepID=A0ABP4WEG4_9MICO|nr:1-phosphofructokinase family hexose kinase [Agromyces humatus]
MIVTLTANPSLDRTVELAEALEPGAVQRATSTRQDPGGKGVNVTRALRASGIESIAVLPAPAGDPLLAALDAEGVLHRAVPIDGAVRTNLTIVDAAGVTTKVNEPGPDLDEAAQARVIAETAEASVGADWLVLAGSLPPGAPDDFYVRVVEAARLAAERAGVAAPRVAADTSGPALAALLEPGVRIDLIKPNAEELAELTGSSDEAALEAGPDEAIALARSIPADRVRASLVTLGAMGAALVDGDHAWFARAPRVVPRSTVGAGDCSLAGFLVASVEGASPADALARAVASGAAAVALPGSAVPTRDQVDPARVAVIEVAGLPVGDRQ